MRLIDAHDVLGRIEKMETVDVVDVVESIIMSQTVDAVPVIRCKDCKYWYQDFEGKCIVSTPYGTDTDEDDFCSRAERKEE